ncbi:MAG TPA: AAA family ATPase [Thermomicrobiales bacterium]|nr:AAA family ATPase [Thermomicrobiales bacterium]
MVSKAGSVPLHGRVTESARLRAALTSAVAGTGRTILITGEPGIGKTRLVEELAVEAREQGVLVLWARCQESEGAPAFWPWTQIIRAAVAASELGPEQGASTGGMEANAGALPSLRAFLSPAPLVAQEAAPANFLRFEAICTFLRNRSSDAPLVIAFDDAQWADTSSLRLLQFAARELGDAAVLLLVTCRDAEAQRKPELARALAELSHLPGSERVTLRGLDEPDIVAIVADMTGDVPPAPVVTALFRRSEGNPFFVTEIVRSLPLATWSSATDDVAAQMPIPPSLLDVMRGRLGRLSPACQEMLATAAIIGRDFSMGVLALVPDGGGHLPAGNALPQLLEEAEGERLIEAVAAMPGRFRFVHVLIREALYAALPAGSRMRLHLQVGEALEEWFGDDADAHLSELAHHFFQAAPEGVALKAVEYASRAADQAVEQLAYEAGAELYDTALRALDLLPAPSLERRYELLMLRGGAEARAGRLDAARDAFLRAGAIARRDHARRRAPESAERLARAALGLQLAALAHGAVDGERVRLIEDALAALDELGAPDVDATTPAALRSRLLARLAMELYYSGEHDRIEALSHEAVERARATGDPATVAFALQARRWVAWGPDTIEERLAIGNELADLARELGDRELLLAGLHTRFVALQELGDMQAVATAAEPQTALAGELRSHYYQWHMAVYRATRAALDGRFDAAEQLARQALASGRRGDAANAEQVFALQRVLLRWQQGSLAGEETTVRQEAGHQQALPVWRCLLARLIRDLGREQEGRQLVDQLAGDRFSGLPRDLFWLCNMALLSETCAGLGDAERAAALYRLLSPYASLNVMAGRAGSLGPVARYLGLLAATCGDHAGASRHFEDALAANERMGARPLTARVQRDYAAMLLRLLADAGERSMPDTEGGRRAEQARAMLEAALATALELGMPDLARDVERLREDLDEHARPPLHPGGLTAREIAVLGLLARGRSNPEIAAELAISVKTVERHTVNIYAKIGARNRVDAAVFALRNGYI